MKRLRTLRGGAWKYFPAFHTGRYRYSDLPSFQKTYGLRIALSAP